MSRAPSMDPEARRRQILQAARAVFARRGYHRTGIADIVDDVQVARGTFYRYYESKRAVFHAVLEEMMHEVVGVVHPIDITRPVLPQVEENLARLIRTITEEDVCRVLFGEALGIDDEGDEALRAFYTGALSRIETALRTGQALGVVRDGDVSIKARMLLGLIKEPVVQATLEAHPLDVDALVEELTTLLRAGLVRSS